MTAQVEGGLNKCLPMKASLNVARAAVPTSARDGRQRRGAAGGIPRRSKRSTGQCRRQTEWVTWLRCMRWSCVHDYRASVAASWGLLPNNWGVRAGRAVRGLCVIVGLHSSLFSTSLASSSSCSMPFASSNCARSVPASSSAPISLMYQHPACPVVTYCLYTLRLAIHSRRHLSQLLSIRSASSRETVALLGWPCNVSAVLVAWF